MVEQIRSPHEGLHGANGRRAHVSFWLVSITECFVQRHICPAQPANHRHIHEVCGRFGTPLFDAIPGDVPLVDDMDLDVHTPITLVENPRTRVIYADAVVLVRLLQECIGDERQIVL